MLPIGNYSIRQLFKDMPFQEFYAENVQLATGNYVDLGSECYKEWWKRNLIDFSIMDTNKLDLKSTFGPACFTGNNPCLNYTGPYLP
tara:strand:- start:29933 stop:30193 length:261 start_codon:yes stop_codon:yes gene_type:complete